MILSKDGFNPPALITLLLSLCLFLSCSAPQVRETPPEEKLALAKTQLKKKRYESARETLEELKLVTAATRLGGEVQFLLAQVLYRQGDLAEAEIGYETYLLSYPDGPFAEEALFYQAQSKVRQLEKVRIGFFSTDRYVPHDRDVSIIRDARVLFQQYLLAYPESERSGEAAMRVTELLTKEGEHELEIASFYLRKKEPAAALARAKRVLENDFPDPVRERAGSIVEKAEAALPDPGPAQGP